MTSSNTKNTQEVKIVPIKGRPMLNWLGKHPISSVLYRPAQHIETFDPSHTLSNPLVNPDIWKTWPDTYPKSGLLFYGENKEVLANLIATGFRNKVNLIYIDPPFNTGVDYIRKVTLRGVATEKIDAEGYSFAEQIQYSINWQTDVFLQFLYERLQLAKELLADDGIIFIRLDVHYGHYLKLIADEIFGTEMFQNEIVVNRIKKNVTNKGRRTIPHALDSLYVYFKSPSAEYKNVLKKLSATRRSYWHSMESSGVPGPRQVIIEGKTYFPSPGTHFKFPQGQVDQMLEEGRIQVNPTSNRPEYLVPEKDVQHLDSDWTDIPGYTFTTGYPTENSEQLLERVISVGSKPGDIVLDFFLGSGTTAVVAQKLGRRWIGCDLNKGAIQTTSRRLQIIIQDQITKQAKPKQNELNGMKDGDVQLMSAQLAFTFQRINNYDLTLQHNEAVNLICQFLGIERNKADGFFDGILGNKLAKIVPFDHPLSPLDLEAVKNELEARGGKEQRSIVMVCIGKQLASDGWLSTWNQYRAVIKRDDYNQPIDFINHIEVIDLRTDTKYKGFIIHQPADASIKISRNGEQIHIQIEDFISPTIIERLKMDMSLFRTQVAGWRSMVNSIEIDLSYDNQVFHIDYSDIPERKDDLVKGDYTFSVPYGPTNVAIKLIDMLGEEIIKSMQVW